MRSFLALFFFFSLPFVFMIAVPHFSLAKLDQVAYTEADTGFTGLYPLGRTGVVSGAQVYSRNGCAYCHTQMIRPTYVAPFDMWRKNWAGDEAFEDQEGNANILPRATRPRDFLGERFAHLGNARIGPDLSNVGVRRSDPKWHYQHLFDPRSVSPGSVMPSFRNLFRKQRVLGLPSEDAVGQEEVGGILYEYLPSQEARALVAYLTTMRKDDKIPQSLVKTE